MPGDRLFHQVMEEEMPDFRHRIRYDLTIELYCGELVMTLTLYTLDLNAIDDQDGYEADTERRGEYFTHLVTTWIAEYSWSHRPQQ